MSAPQVSIVVVTHKRAARISRLLDSLRAQTLATSEFEVLVVDNNEPGDATSSVLARARERGDLDLRVLGGDRVLSLAAARNLGWREARAPLVGFLDDDCHAAPEWLSAVLLAAEADPGAVFQGRVEPDPADAHLLGPFSRTVHVSSPSPYFNTNVFYPRELLERLGGLDEVAYAVSLGGGEDTDLAWRAIEAGAPTTFAPDARVYHPVEHIGPMGKLGVAARWRTIPVTYQRHPRLRRADLDYGIFWKNHYLLVRALIALALPRRGAACPWASSGAGSAGPTSGTSSYACGRRTPRRCTCRSSSSTT